MMTRPYESETVKEAHRKVNEEKRRREEEAKGSNDRLRALQVNGSWDGSERIGYHGPNTRGIA